MVRLKNHRTPLGPRRIHFKSDINGLGFVKRIPGRQEISTIVFYTHTIVHNSTRTKCDKDTICSPVLCLLPLSQWCKALMTGSVAVRPNQKTISITQLYCQPRTLKNYNGWYGCASEYKKAVCLTYPRHSVENAIVKIKKFPGDLFTWTLSFLAHSFRKVLTNDVMNDTIWS